MKYMGTHFTDLDGLCKELDISVGDFCYFANNVDRHVKKRQLIKKDGKPREILAPAKPLKAIQRAIKDKILQSYTYPAYVYGLGGDTLLDHALVHRGEKQLVKMDLRDFFPSIDHNKVYRMWLVKFDFTPELARLLTKLVTHEGRLQQGFPTSSHLAAIISEPFTKRMADYCTNSKLKFSQYVDDLNFSGDTINHKELFKLSITAAREEGFSVKRKKTKVYAPLVGKEITGVSLFDQRTRPTREVRKRAVTALKSLAGNPLDEHSLKVVNGYRRFIGHLNKDEGQRYQDSVNTIQKQKGNGERHN